MEAGIADCLEGSGGQVGASGELLELVLEGEVATGHRKEPEFPAQPWLLALNWEQSVLWPEGGL